LPLTLLALLAGSAAVGPLGSQVRAPVVNDQGVFEIFSAGKSIGSETFEIRAHSGQIEAQSNVHLRVEQNGKTLEVRTSSTLLLDPHFDALSYAWNQKVPQPSQLSIDFRAQPTRVRYKTVNGQDDRRDFKLDKDVVVLDDNAVLHYQLAIAHYDQVKGGRQEFRAFIPQEALPGVISLNLVGPGSVIVNGAQRTLRHFVLTTEQAELSLWVDEQGHLQLVSAPSAQFEAIRKK
jgi:hypothetical protein